MTGSQKLAESTLSLKMEKEKVLEVLIGPAGRFLSLKTARKGDAAKEKVEPWRALPLHIAAIIDAVSIKDCIRDVAMLHTLIEELDSKSIRRIAKIVISEKSLEALKGDMLVKVTKSRLLEQFPVMSKAEIGRLCNELGTKMNETDQGRRALAELNDTFEKAMNGDNAVSYTHLTLPTTPYV